MPAHTALLVVDMQHGFLDAGASLEVPQGRGLVPRIERLIACCRSVGTRVIFTKFVYSPAVPCLRGEPFGVEHLPPPDGQPTGHGRPSGNCLVGPRAGQGAESADIIPELAPRADELVVASHGYDKFLDTPLDLALRSQGITHLIVTGIVTDICVNCTVLSAANRNYYVTVATDGVATLNDAIQAACFDIWRRKFARLRTTRQLVAELKNGQSESSPSETATPHPALSPSDGERVSLPAPSEARQAGEGRVRGRRGPRVSSSSGVG